MFETLQRLYNEGRLTETELSNAVVRGWITEEQKGVILDANKTS